ncbi:MAG: hypothetical protein ACM3PW_11710, partial [Chlamydiota bacterium]
MLGDKRLACLVILLWLSAAQLLAASPHSGEEGSAALGTVDFPSSCTPTAQKTVEQGVELLHSFQYQQVEQTFSQAVQQDPRCAIAYWGKAMGLYHQLWDFPTDAT